MPLPAVLGGFLKGAAGAGARGAVKSGVARAIKPKGKGGALVKPKQSMSMAQPSGAIVPVKSSGGGSDGGGGALSTSIAPKSQKSTAIVKSNLSGNESAIEVLRSVKQTADQILEVEVRDLGSSEEELKQRKDQIDDERKALEASKREEEQDKQESKKKKPKRKKANPIVNAAKKTVGGIWDFLTGMLGEFIKYKILDWISKPENREKILGIVRFVQKIPEYFGIFKEKVIDPWWPVVSKIAVGGFKIFKEFLDVFLDLVTLNFLRNPDEFFENLLDIPKTIIEVVPGIIDSLLEAITGGAIKNIGELADSVFKNPLEGIDFGAALSGLGGSIGDLFKKPLEVIGGALTTAKDAFVGGAQATGQFIGDRASDTMDFLGSAFNAVTGTQPASAGTLDSAPAQPTVSTVIPKGETNLSAVSGYEITSAYGSREGFRTKDHGGLDIGTPVGTNIALAEDGEIVAAGRYGGYGNLIDAWLPKTGVQLRMAHLASIVKNSGSFKAGEVIGKTGGAAGDPGAGSSTGPHLHFEMDRVKGGAAYGGSGDPTPFAKLLMLGGGTTGIPKPEPSPSASPIVANQIQPSSGKTLTQIQRENQMLEDSGLSALQTPIVTNNSNTSQSLIEETVSSTLLGSTLPKSGLHATYKGV
jgi:murein DD-endopeptidase MepM/ murein hydrolase activator NlpD|tara:strand:- start:516 stop:2444 length:1929 start_codon:yes stop_codon:yes gene_type:complete